VGLARFELATTGLGNRCSIHLSYSPDVGRIPPRAGNRSRANPLTSISVMALGELQSVSFNGLLQLLFFNATRPGKNGAHAGKAERADYYWQKDGHCFRTTDVVNIPIRKRAIAGSDAATISASRSHVALRRFMPANCKRPAIGC
jgi:hypothetical protein